MRGRSPGSSRNYNSVLHMRHVTKSAEPVTSASELPNVLRRAFTQLKTGRGGPALVEIPRDVCNEEVAEPLDYKPATAARIGPDPDAVARGRQDAGRGRSARCIYAGQGVH